MNKQAIKQRIKKLEIDLKLSNDVNECFLIRLSIDKLKDLLK